MPDAIRSKSSRQQYDHSERTVPELFPISQAVAGPRSTGRSASGTRSPYIVSLQRLQAKTQLLDQSPRGDDLSLCLKLLREPAIRSDEVLPSVLAGREVANNPWSYWVRLGGRFARRETAGLLDNAAHPPYVRWLEQRRANG